MSDTATEIVDAVLADVEATAPEGTIENPDGSVSETVEEAKPEKPKREKKVVEPKPCLCAVFMLLDKEDEDATFTTECESTTLSTFTQGHDARLVSFLVRGQLDGYSIVRTDGEGGSLVAYTDAGHAAASVSAPLGEKADKALVNATERDAKKAQAKIESAERREAKKAETAAKKEAEKANKATEPKAVAARVAKGSETGDAKPKPTRPEPEEGEEAVVIKVGRNEIPATLNAEKTEVRWVDATGKPQVRPADTVRVLPQS